MEPHTGFYTTSRDVTRDRAGTGFLPYPALRNDNVTNCPVSRIYVRSNERIGSRQGSVDIAANGLAAMRVQVPVVMGRSPSAMLVLFPHVTAEDCVTEIGKFSHNEMRRLLIPCDFLHAFTLQARGAGDQARVEFI
jgi:hypothetical protein